MIRSIIILGTVLILALFLRQQLTERDKRINPRYEGAQTLSAIIGVAADTITGIGVIFRPGQEWVYIKKDDIWRIPQYRWAYAQAAPLDSTVKQMTESLGIAIHPQSRPDSFFGFPDEGHTIRIKLYDDAGTVLTEAICGGGVPGWQQGGSYIKLADGETIYHITGSPGRYPPAPSPQLPPLTDGALGRVPVHTLERREKVSDEEGEEDAVDPRMRDIPQYEWYAVTANGEWTVDERAAYQFINSVQGITYDTLPSSEELAEIENVPPEFKWTLEYEIPVPPATPRSQRNSSRSVEPIPRATIISTIADRAWYSPCLKAK